jgi:hypothetical protein
MDIKDIIISLKLHIKNNEFSFYRKCINKLQNKTGTITNVGDDPYILTSVKIHMLYQKNYNI